MKKSNRVFAVIMAIMMVFAYMPGLAYAAIGNETDGVESDNQSANPAAESVGSGMQIDEESESVTEVEEEPEAVKNEESSDVTLVSSGTINKTPDVNISDNDELLMQYFDMQVDKAAGKVSSGAGTGQRKAKSTTRYSKLNETEQYIYNEILSMMQGVVNGEISDATVSIDLSEQLAPYYDDSNYADYEHSITSERLGIDSAVFALFGEDDDAYWDFTDEAKGVLFDIDKIIDAILIDNPSYTYWFDKKAGYGYELNFYCVEEAVESDVYFSGNPMLSMSFSVVEAYRGESENQYSVDESQTEAIVNATEMVRQILADNAECEDLEKLQAYKDTVCELTAYNQEAAENEETPYGDPWQLIWVFDNDPDTNVVCEGYSKAFQYLCDKTTFENDSIECHTVTGNMSGGTGEGNHMWNILHMDDGRNYMADITNSDEDSSGEDGGLFIAPALEGNVDDGYGYMDTDEDGNADIFYLFDDDTRRIYEDSELKMSKAAYGDDEPEEPEFEETIIPIELEEEVSFTATKDKSYQIYSFTPEKDGYYRFESIGDVDTYGEIGFMDEGIFQNVNYDYDSGENQNFNLYFSAYKGETVYLKARTYSEVGEEVSFVVRVAESSKIEGIELDIGGSLSFCERTHGYWSNDSEGNRFWYYNFPGFKDGDTLTVTYDNDSVVYTYNDGIFHSRDGTIETIELYASSDQSEDNKWEVGEHEFTFTYRDATVIVPVEITESRITTVDFTPAKPLTYIAGVDGETSTSDNGDTITYYSSPNFSVGDTLTVDGTEYVYSETSMQFISEDGDAIDQNDIEWISSDQYSEPWDVGHHAFEFGYMGRFTNYPVEVIENPIKSIKYIPASPYIYYEGTDAYDTTSDEEGVEHDLYHTPGIGRGDKLIINGTEEYTAVVDHEGGKFVDLYEKYGDRQLQFSSDQEAGEYWVLGSSNYVTVTYCGKTCMVPVTIAAPADIEEISYQPVKDYVLTENVDGYYEYEYDEDGNETRWFYYDVYRIKGYREDGDVLTIDGKQYTLRNIYYISADGERILSNDVNFATDQGPDNQWGPDDGKDHFVTVSYKGASCTVPVTINASPVTNIEFEPYRPYQFYEHAGGYWNFEDYDESSGDERKYYYYSLSEYRIGDKLTVYKGEESTEYTYRYDGDSRQTAFFTEDGSDMIESGEVYRSSSQSYNNQWQVGEHYEATVSYMGVSCTVDVSVVANPIESIEYEPADGKFIISENTKGYWDDYDKIYRYDSPHAQPGDRLTLRMTSGDEIVYEYAVTQEGAYFTDISDESNRLDTQYLEYNLEQNEEWEAGNTYNCTVRYMGKECLTSFYIIYNPVTEFSVTLSEPLKMKDSVFAEANRGYEFGEEYYHFDDDPLLYIDGWDEASGRRLFRTGDYISVTSAQGTQMYTLEDGNNYFDDGKGNKILCSEIEMWSDGSWTYGGDPKVVMRYMGKEAHPVSVEVYPDPDHTHSMVHHGMVDAGCFTEGYTEYWYCQGCDRYFADANGEQHMTYEDAIIGFSGHSWDEGVVTTEATCQDKGVMTYTCTRCGEKRTQPTPANRHIWNDGEIKEPSTCVREGDIEFTCDICGITKTEKLPYAAHKFVHVEAKEPTCESSGNVEYWNCNVCGRVFSDENGEHEIEETYLTPIPHTLTEKPAVEATCDEDGHEAYWECTACDAMFSDANGENRINGPNRVPAIGHDWGEWEQTSTPTCEEDGAERRVCSRDADHTDTRAIAALGHVWTGEPEYTWADDYSKVTATVTCSRDSSHTLKEASIPSCKDTATCTAGGFRTYTALFNKQEFETQTKEVESGALGHDYRIEYSWLEDGSTCTATATCARDDTHVETEESKSTSTVKTPATCTQKGTTTYTAVFESDLFAKQTKNINDIAIDENNHDYWKVADTAKAATCMEEGKEADRECSRCHDKINGDVIPVLGHDYRDVSDSSKSPTCTEAGKKIDQKCSRCNDVITGDSIPATGHDLKKTEAKAVTCEVNGNIEYWTCSTCGKLFKDAEAATAISEADIVIPAEGHKWGEPVFTFSEGGGSATATRTCLNDETHKETVDAVVTSEITKVATADEKGEITYTATALFDEKEYTDAKKVEANTYIPQTINQLSAIGDTHSIRLAWTQSHEVGSEIYCIYRREALTDQKELIKKIYSRTTLSYTDKDVVDGKKYTYYVTTINGFGQESAPSPEATAAAMEDTEKPQVVQMSPADNALIGGKQKISAKATDNVQVTSVVLEISTDEGDSWQKIAESADSSITCELDTTAYAGENSSEKIRVRAIAYDAANNASDPFSREYSIDNDSPSQVQNVTATATSTSVTLKWDENKEDSDIKFYRVEQVISDDMLKKIEDVTALGVVIRGLKSATEYTYQVTAYDTLGNCSTASKRVTVTTADDDVVPQILTIEPAASYVSGKLEVSVKAKDNMGLASIVIQSSRDTLSWDDVSETEFDNSPEEATAKATIDTDQIEEGSLYIRARVTDASGNENDYIRMKPVEYKVDRTAPAKVTGLSAEAQPGNVRLKWAKSEEEDLGGYNLYRSEDGETFAIVQTSAGNECTDHTASKSGQTYTYKVAAVDEAGNIGELSDAVEVISSADTEAPVINAYDPSSGSDIGPGKKTLSMLVSDNSELSDMRITYTVDSKDDASDVTEEQPLYENNSPGNYYLNIAGDLPVDDLMDGDVITIHVYASDISGNKLENHNITYTVDKTAPVVGNVEASLQNGDDSVKLQIRGNGAPDLRGYYIYRKGTDGKNEYLTNIDSATHPEGYDSCIYTDKSVKAGNSYTYMVVAYDACGNTGFRETEEVIIPEKLILTAELTCDNLIEGDVEYYFSGIKSKSSLGIKEYSFDFGDGSEVVTGPDARVVHRYREPAEDDADGTDSYTVKLTVTDNEGNTAEITRDIKVKRQALVGRVIVTVVDSQGGALSNVPVYFDMDNTLERVKTTDNKGQVQFTSDAGRFAVGAYTADYLPVRRIMSVNANTNNEITLTLTEKEIVTGSFEVTRLTLDEIREMGIDTSDPDNIHLARINVKLTYGEIEAIVDQNGVILELIKSISTINLLPGKPGKEKPPIDWPENWRDWHSIPDNSGSGGFWDYTPPVPFVAVLDVPIQASFLKEFFDVRLHIINNAASEFTIADNVVSLTVPEGMTLMDLEHTDGSVVRFDSLSGQETKTIDWCLRGDKAGSYNLTADYSGVLKEFATEVKGSFDTSEPITVYGIEAGKVIMEVDPHVQYGVFYTKISLQNVGDADMYLPNIGIVDDLIHATEKYSKEKDEDGYETITLESDKSVELINEYLEDSEGYSQAIPNNTNITVLSKGQMLSKRYACYNAIETEDLAELQSVCSSIAEGYGIGFEFRVRQHSLYDIEEGDTEAAQAKKDYILGPNGESAYNWIKDSGNSNFYYYIQSISSQKNIGTQFAVQSHRVLSVPMKLDFDLFTGEDKKAVTRKIISEMMRDEQYVQQVEDRLDNEYLDVTSKLIDWTAGQLSTHYDVEHEDIGDIKKVLGDAENICKLSQAVRSGEPEKFMDRAMNMLGSTYLAHEKELYEKIDYGFAHMLETGSMDNEFGKIVSNKVKSLGPIVETIDGVLEAYNNSAVVYNQLLMLWVSKEQATELLDIILECDENEIDHDVYEEVEKLRSDLDKNYLAQSELFTVELNKFVHDTASSFLVDKTSALMDYCFFTRYTGASAGPISVTYAIAKFIFDGVDYTLGWGTAVDSVQTLQIAADLTQAVRIEMSSAANGDDPEYFLTCLKYLIKLRLVGEKSYIEAAKAEEEDEGILDMIRDDYKQNYKDLDAYYLAFKKQLLSYRDSLFRDVEGTVDTPFAPEVGIDYAAETTNKEYGSEYEYSFGGIGWKDCNGEAIKLSPGSVSRDLRIRKKADGEHPTGNSAYVAVPPRPIITGDAECRYMVVKGSGSVYVIEGIPDGTYLYELTDESELNELGKDAKTLTMVNGSAEIADSDGKKAAYIAICKPAVISGSDVAFKSDVRTIGIEKYESGDIAVVKIEEETALSEGVAEEFRKEASAVTVTTDGTVLENAATNAAAESNVTAASVLDQLKEELADKEDSGVTKGTRVWDVRLVMQTYLDLKIKEVTGNESDGIKTIVVDITPKARIIATTNDIPDKDIKVGTNALKVEERELNIGGQKTRIGIKLPASFDNESNTVYVLHNDIEEYAAEIVKRDAETGEITIVFDTNGFSPFRMSTESATSISVGGVGYTSLAAAVDAAKDGETIVLKDEAAADTKVNEANEALSNGACDEMAELKVTAAEEAAGKAVEVANAVAEDMEKALKTALAAAEEEPDNEEKQAAVTVAEQNLAAAKKLVATANATKASSKKAVATLMSNKSDEAKAKAAAQTKGTQEAIDAANEALEAAKAAAAAAKSAEEAALTAVDAAEAAARAAGVDPEEDPTYKAAKNALDDAETASNDAAKVLNKAKVSLQTAETDKVVADAAMKAAKDKAAEEAAKKAAAKKAAEEAAKKAAAKKAAEEAAKKAAAKKAAEEAAKKVAARAVQKGADGTALGAGASAENAEKAITASASDEGPKGSKYAQLKLRSTKQGKTNIKLTWSKVKGARKYVIYGNACGKKNKMRRIATSTGSAYNIKKLANKKALKKGTYHKFMVVALNAKNDVVSTSKVIHVTTKGSKVGNNKSLTIKAKVNKTGKAIKTAKVLKSTVIKKGKSITIKTKTTPANKKLTVKKHRAISYESNNVKIATVNAKGKITAKSKGTCYIYAYTQEGIFQKIKISVK